MSDDWFAGDPPRGPAFDQVFVDRVRELAPQLLEGRVDPGDTWYTDYADLLVVWVRWTGAWAAELQNSLQVRWADGELTGCWAGDHLWDDVDLRDLGALVVRGARISSTTAAEAAVRWMVRQLERPVEHQTWTRSGSVVAERWVVADDGPVLARHGSWWARRGQPSSVHRVT